MARKVAARGNEAHRATVLDARAGPASGQLIGLQRTAGNAAVSAILGKRNGGSGQEAGRRAGELGFPVAQRDAPPAGGTAGRLNKLEADDARRDKRDKACTHLQSFSENVSERSAKWEAAILRLGTAYSVAAKNHTDAVDAKKKGDAIKSQLMFSALTVLATGGLAWLQTLEPIAAVLGEGAGDTISAGVAEVLSANGPGLDQRYPTAAQTAISDDPLVFQNQRLERLKTSEGTTHRFIRQSIEDLIAQPMEKWDAYDEAKQLAEFASWLRRADLLADEAKMPTLAAMSRELERGFWAKWAPRMLRTATVPDMDIRGLTLKVISYDSPGSAVEARLTALGITAEAGVADFGWWTTDTEIQKIIDWSYRYTAVPFG